MFKGSTMTMDQAPPTLAEMLLNERKRIADVIARDKADRIADRDRLMAELEVRRGVFVNLDDTVMPPTPEWLAKGEVKPFTPRLIGEGGRTQTVKTVRTVRRVIISTVVRMALAGKITDNQFAACRWYRDVHDQAGIEGRYKTSHLSLAGNVGGSGGNAQHPMAQHEREASARQSFRRARGAINPRFVEVFEGVVIHDLSLRAASIKAKRDNARLLPRFQYSCDRLLDHLSAMGMDISGTRDDDA